VSTAGLGLVFLTAIAVQAAAIAQTWGGGYWRLGAGAAVVVCLLALLRRRQVLWTAIAGLAVAAVAIAVARIAGLPTEPSPAMVLGLSVLAGSAVRALPLAAALGVTGAGFAVVTGGIVAARAPAYGMNGVVTISAALWLVGVAVGLSLRLLDDRARRAVERTRQAERLELARELHDVVAHHITAMLIQAQAAQVVARRSPAEVADCLEGIDTAGSEALTAMRRVVGLLRDEQDPPPAAPGPEQLTALVERFSRQGPPVLLRLPDGGRPWPPELISTVYRIVQEALTNVSRHAVQARSVTVTVEDRPGGGVSVEVVDDAPPGPARLHHRGGYGLIGMRERVEMLGGTMDAGPRPAGGWRVRAVLP
jgi:signal transduction histidine kinase